MCNATSADRDAPQLLTGACLFLVHGEWRSTPNCFDVGPVADYPENKLNIILVLTICRAVLLPEPFTSQRCRVNSSSRSISPM